jgi:hypothetical protein
MLEGMRRLGTAANYLHRGTRDDSRRRGRKKSKGERV